MAYAKEPETITVLIADDHALVREGLALLVEREDDMHVVAQASDGCEAVEMFRQFQPGVALLDLRMPNMDGADAIKAIHQEFPDANLIALTTYSAEEEVYRVLQAGARGYLLKDVSRDDLLDAIRAVYAGEPRIPPEILTKLSERIRKPTLTHREMEVLELISLGLSNLKIAEALYITEGTVKSHINSILDKLGVHDRTQAALAAIKRGLVYLE